MSPDSNNVESIAIALVVESSLPVAEEWGRKVLEYVSKLLKRLTDTHPGFKLRIALVTYGSTDTFPSPLLCKRFFADFQQVLREMKDDQSKLGIGQTNHSEGRGMAALEGLVAAIELFDVLREYSQSKDAGRSQVNHIFHVIASSPDSTQCPMWNTSTILDHVTWDTLPLELKKRNINTSFIFLRPQPAKISELFSAAGSTGPSSPWFNLSPPHSMLLSGFSPVSQQKTTKRTNENTPIERTPESKRQRVGQSPKLPIMKTPPNLGPAVSTPSRAQPPTTAALAPNTNNGPLPQTNIPRLPQQQFIERMRAAEEQLRNLELSIQEAKAMGNNELVEKLTQDLTKRKEAQQKFKMAITSYAQNQNMAARQQQAQVHAAANAIGIPSVARTNSSPALADNKDAVPATLGLINEPNNNMVQGQNLGINTDSQVPAQLFQNRPTNPSNYVPLPNTNTNVNNSAQQAMMGGSMPSNVATQIQKLFDQQQRNRPTGHLGNTNMNILQNQIGERGLNQSANAMQTQAEASYQNLEQSMANGSKPNAIPVWTGALCWSGTSSNGKKEVRTYVVASTQNPGASHPETWPQTLSLVPTREPAVPLNDIQLWMKRHEPVLCTFQVQARVTDPKTNESYYRTLVQLLTMRNAYAVAAWTLPSGEQSNNALIFPVNGVGLAGAFFPTRGIPEMPKPTVMPSGQSTMNNFIARMQQMTPEQRAHIMAQYTQRQQLQRAQLMAQQHAGDGGAGSASNQMAMAQAKAQQIIQQNAQQSHDLSTAQFGLNIQNSNMGLMGMMGPHGAHNGANLMNSMGATNPGAVSAGLPRPVSGGPNGGIPNSVSLEMLESFMQRNPGGGHGMGPT